MKSTNGGAGLISSSAGTNEETQGSCTAYVPPVAGMPSIVICPGRPSKSPEPRRIVIVPCRSAETTEPCPSIVSGKVPGRVPAAPAYSVSVKKTFPSARRTPVTAAPVTVYHPEPVTGGEAVAPHGAMVNNAETPITNAPDTDQCPVLIESPLSPQLSDYRRGTRNIFRAPENARLKGSRHLPRGFLGAGGVETGIGCGRRHMALTRCGGSRQQDRRLRVVPADQLLDVRAQGLRDHHVPVPALEPVPLVLLA